MNDLPLAPPFLAVSFHLRLQGVHVLFECCNRRLQSDYFVGQDWVVSLAFATRFFGTIHVGSVSERAASWSGQESSVLATKCSAP